MVSHMVFLTKLGFEVPKNLVTPSPFCKVGRVTKLLDGRVISSPWKKKNFQGLDDDFKYGIWGDFSKKFQVLCKNPDEVTRFDGTVNRVTSSGILHKTWNF